MYWCLGLHSSASTWIFNAARKIAEVLLPDKPIVAPFVLRSIDLPSFDEGERLIIVKSHETDEAAAVELGNRAQAIWISIRDPRDAVASLVTYNRLDFDAALHQIAIDARFCGRFVCHPRARLFRFESQFSDAPETVDQIAAGFHAILPRISRDRIFSELRRSTIEAFICQLEQLPRALRPSPTRVVDPVTKWHNHHANRTGQIGRWRRELTSLQASAIERELTDWMVSFGYSTEG